MSDIQHSCGGQGGFLVAFLIHGKLVPMEIFPGPITNVDIDKIADRHRAQQQHESEAIQEIHLIPLVSRGFKVWDAKDGMVTRL